jgi:hypothetical protein
VFAWSDGNEASSATMHHRCPRLKNLTTQTAVEHILQRTGSYGQIKANAWRGIVPAKHIHSQQRNQGLVKKWITTCICALCTKGDYFRYSVSLEISCK